jgi:hypothetical protein
MIVISNSLDTSSSGLVVKNFINHALNKSDSKRVNIIMENINIPMDIDSSFHFGNNNYHGFWQKIVLIVFGVSVVDYFRSIRVKNYLNKDILRNQEVFIFITGINFFTLYIARFVAKLGFQKINIHFLDPLVSKHPWGENLFLRQSKKKLVFKLLNSLKSRNCQISTTNNACSEYLKIEYELHSIPSSYISYKLPVKRFLEVNSKNSDKIHIYYRGTFNNMRGGVAFLKLLNSISEVQNEYHFIFQGKVELTKEDLMDLHKLTFLDFSIDSYWLNNADILLDIDLVKPDVFVSGKFFEYLQYSKPILIISPPFSAINTFVGDYYSDCKSIMTAEFNYSSVVNCLKQLKSLMTDWNHEVKNTTILQPNCILDLIEK